MGLGYGSRPQKITGSLTTNLSTFHEDGSVMTSCISSLNILDHLHSVYCMNSSQSRSNTEIKTSRAAGDFAAMPTWCKRYCGEVTAVESETEAIRMARNDI